MQQSTDHHPPAWKGVVCVLFSVLVWSGWIVVSRYGVKGTLSSYDITALRFGIAGLLMLPLAYRRGVSVGPYGFRGGCALAFFIGAPYTNLAVAGMQFAPASHASTIINGAMLSLATLVGVLKLGEKTSAARLTGIAFSFLGIGCMLSAKSAGGSQQWLGHLLFIVSGLMWASYVLLVRAWKAEAMHGAAIVCVLSMAGYLPLYLLFAAHHISLSNWHEVVFQAFYQGALTGVAALVSFNNGIRILGASQASAFIPLVPVFSTLIAIPILHERPSALEWGGVLAVSCGVLLSSGVFSRRVVVESCEAGPFTERSE